MVNNNMNLWKKEYQCPCGGNFVNPDELGFHFDGCHFICDSEDRGDGSPCERFVFIDDREQYLKPNPLRRLWNRYFVKKKVYDVFSKDFHTIALKLSGVHWAFNRLKSGSRCCVLDCPYSREYGYWTCRKHRELELKHFDPVDEYGNLFYSHKYKKY